MQRRPERRDGRGARSEREVRPWLCDDPVRQLSTLATAVVELGASNLLIKRLRRLEDTSTKLWCSKRLADVLASFLTVHRRRSNTIRGSSKLSHFRSPSPFRASPHRPEERRSFSSSSSRPWRGTGILRSCTWSLVLTSASLPLVISVLDDDCHDVKRVLSRQCDARGDARRYQGLALHLLGFHHVQPYVLEYCREKW